MLQLSPDHEQFSSLPSLRAIDHPRHSIITTDRPDSSQLVDLHVYIVPKTVWQDGQRLAQNEAMDDAVSAGFVRVPPSMSIRNLRKSIEQLCRLENDFPRDFIYLRSVGRCLTKVKATQEDELRVKNYRPPQTFAPEIYLLEGRSDDHGQHIGESIPESPPLPQTSGFSPGYSSPCDICGNHDGHRSPGDGNHSAHNRHPLHHNDMARSPSKLSQNYYRQPMRSGRHYSPTMKPNGNVSHTRSFNKQNRPKFTVISSDPEDSSTNLSDATSVASSHLVKLKEEQERLRRRQAELERMRRAAEEKRGRSERSDGERSRSDDDEAARKTQAPYRGLKDHQDNKERKRDDNHKVSDPKRSKLGGHNNEFENSRNEMIDAERREAEAKRRRQQDEADQKRKTKDLEEQRRRDLAKLRDDPESLRARHQEVRLRRVDLEKVREEVIKHLKNIHNRITLRRKEARDLWKKKYFNEKKKHPPLEERIGLLKTELDQIHKKTIQAIEAEAKYASQMGYTREAETGNSLSQIIRIQNEIRDVRHQVEQAKLRLTTDVKLRNQAENECRSLKHELNQARMNLNDIKSRAGP